MTGQSPHHRQTWDGLHARGGDAVATRVPLKNVRPSARDQRSTPVPGFGSPDGPAEGACASTISADVVGTSGMQIRMSSFARDVWPVRFGTAARAFDRGGRGGMSVTTQARPVSRSWSHPRREARPWPARGRPLPSTSDRWSSMGFGGCPGRRSALMITQGFRPCRVRRRRGPGSYCGRRQRRW